MEIDKTKIKTQDEIGEPAPMDQVEERVEAEMKLAEGRAKEQVAHGMQDENLEREAQRLKEEAARKLKEVTENTE